MKIDHSIVLTAEEQELFELLLQCLEHFEKKTVMRVAGGWVRDKLLGKLSHDIDIALDDQSGLEFANMVNEYLTLRGLETRTIAVIQANPDQSKHLETANLRVLGFEIDCVNLRAETYADSRIPQIRIGTAEEDALRRDFTINALFYNIRSKDIEDFTEKGLDDLRNKFIRTPLPSFVTFRDDPLRILRAIRFSSRLHFRLCQELQAAASHADIKAALLTKVSRERIYKEVEGMIIHAECRPAIAFSWLHRLHVLDAVLPVHPLLTNHTFVRLLATPSAVARLVPSDWDVLACWSSTAVEAIHYVNVLLQMRADGGYRSSLSAEALARPHPAGVGHVKALYWAACVAFLGEVTVLEKKKEMAFFLVLLRDGIKMETSTMRHIQSLVDCALQFLCIDCSERISVDRAAQLLRQCKELWRDAVLLATALELVSLHSLHRQPSIAMAMQPEFSDLSLTTAQQAVIGKYHALEGDIDALRLDKVWELKPLHDGAVLLKELALAKGPAVGKAMEEQMLWQIRTRSEDRELCMAHLKTVFLHRSHDAVATEATHNSSS